METSNSGANHAVLHGQNDRCELGPIETINSGHNVAVVNAQNNRWELRPIETCNSGAKDAVLNAKTQGEVLDPQRLVILVQKSLFCMKKQQIWAGTYRD